MTYISSSKDLCALSLVSKTSHAATEPYLYRVIDWSGLPPEPTGIVGSRSRAAHVAISHPITKLLRTVLRRPELANHVKIVKLRGDRSRFYDWKYIGSLTTPIVDVDIETSTQIIRSTSVDHCQEWIDGLTKGAMDAIMSLLILQLSNLRTIVLGPPFTGDSTLTRKLFMSALLGRCCQLPSYEHLQDLTFELVPWSTSWKRPGVKFADALPFFYLGFPRKISIGLDSPERFAWLSHAPRLTALTHLDLHLVRERHLSTILSVTPNLRTFRWVLFCNLFAYPDEVNVDIVRLGEAGAALLQVCHTLEEFIISNVTDLGDGPSIASSLAFNGNLGDLRRLYKLRSLSAPLEMLMATFEPANCCVELKDVMPPNIEMLTISDEMYAHNRNDYEPPWEENDWHGSEFCDIIKIWLGDKSSPKPPLRTLTFLETGIFNGRSFSFYWGPKVVSDIVDLCESSDITVNFVEAPITQW